MTKQWTKSCSDRATDNGN